MNRAIWAWACATRSRSRSSPSARRMFINDVGQNTWEEINEGSRRLELRLARHRGADQRPALRLAASTPTARRSSADRCAITGGAFYTAGRPPVPGRLRRRLLLRRLLQPAGSAGSTPATSPPRSFATGISSPGRPEGRRRRQPLLPRRGTAARPASSYRITYANTPPTHHIAPVEPHGRAGRVGHVHRGGLGRRAARATSGSATARTSRARPRRATRIASAQRVRQRRALPRRRRRTPFGTATSNEATLTVTRTRPPSPRSPSRPRARSTAAGRRSTSPGRRPTPRTALSRQRVHVARSTSITTRTSHPFIQPTSGITSGSFVIPTTGETAANVWYRIHLTVRDSAGLTHTTFRDVLPRTVQVTVATNPAGLQVRIDGQPVTAPTTIHGRRRNPADAHGGDAADVGRHDLRVPELVGRRRGAALDLDAGVELDLHGDVRPNARRVRGMGSRRSTTTTSTSPARPSRASTRR